MILLPAYLCHVAITSNASPSTGSSTPRLRADRIRKRAKEKGYNTVAEMAVAFELSRQQLYRLFDGTYLPSLPTAQRIATALDLPVEDLIEAGDSR